VDTSEDLVTPAPLAHSAFQSSFGFSLPLTGLLTWMALISIVDDVSKHLH
jgi:hypothetical protein